MDVFHDLLVAQQVQWANEGVVGPLVVNPIKFVPISEPIDHELGFRDITSYGIARKFIEEGVLGWLIHHQILVFVCTVLRILRQTNGEQSLENGIERLVEDVRKSATKLMDNGAFSIDIEDFEESASRIARNSLLDSKEKPVVNLNLLLEDLAGKTGKRLAVEIRHRRNLFVSQNIDYDLLVLSPDTEDLLIVAYDNEISKAFIDYGGDSIRYTSINNLSVEKSHPESTTLQKSCEKNSEGTVLSRFLLRLENAFLSMFRL